VAFVGANSSVSPKFTGYELSALSTSHTSLSLNCRKIPLISHKRKGSSKGTPKGSQRGFYHDSKGKWSCHEGKFFKSQGKMFMLEGKTFAEQREDVHVFGDKFIISALISNLF
jgi:hypothetical protein